MHTDPEDDRQTDSAMPDPHLRRGPQRVIKASGQIMASSGVSRQQRVRHKQCLNSHGDLNLKQEEDTQVQQETHQREAQLARH